MNDAAALTLPDRVTSLIEGLMKDVEAEVGWAWLRISFIKLFWRRLRRMKARFASVLARLRAGGLAAGPPPAAGSARPLAPARPADGSHPADGTHPADGPPPLALPRHIGWVQQVIAGTIIRRFELEEILEDPETAPLVASAPQLGRVLRPLCRMLRVALPAWLRLPRRPRRPRPKPARKPGHWTVIRLGAGQFWTHPTPLWPTRELAEKFDAKIRVWVDEEGRVHDDPPWQRKQRRRGFPPARQ